MTMAQTVYPSRSIICRHCTSMRKRKSACRTEMPLFQVTLCPSFEKSTYEHCTKVLLSDIALEEQFPR